MKNEGPSSDEHYPAKPRQRLKFKNLKKCGKITFMARKS